MDDDSSAADTAFQVDAEAAIFRRRMADDGHVVEPDGTAWVNTRYGTRRVPNN